MQEADYYAISCSLFIRIVIIATISVIFNILLYFLDITRHVFIDPLHWPGRGSFLPTQNPTDFLLRKSMGFISISSVEGTILGGIHCNGAQQVQFRFLVGRAADVQLFQHVGLLAVLQIAQLQ